MSLRIVRIAAGATFQDRGRAGWRRFGVPVGGAFDRESYQSALELVGRSEGESLEIPIPGGEFVAKKDDRLALVGGGLRAVLNGNNVELHSAFDVEVGSTLSLVPTDVGLRSYLASARGWEVAPILGSVSGVVAEGELASKNLAPNVKLVGSRKPESLTERSIRVVRGPQARDEDLKTIEDGVFKVSLQSNRVGIRLAGPQFETAEEFPSEPSCLGAVQLAPSGELLIHGPDGPTVAGYPKIAVVVNADCDKLAQLRPLQEVRFEVISSDEAGGGKQSKETGSKPAPAAS